VGTGSGSGTGVGIAVGLGLGDGPGDGVGVGDGIGSCFEKLGGRLGLPLPVGREISPTEPNRNNATTRILILLFIVLSSVRALPFDESNWLLRIFLTSAQPFLLYFAPVLVGYLHRFFPGRAQCRE
jgi:hypothetical protein